MELNLVLPTHTYVVEDKCNNSLTLHKASANGHCRRHSEEFKQHTTSEYSVISILQYSIIIQQK
jgi:hypothetical protein